MLKRGGKIYPNWVNGFHRTGWGSQTEETGKSKVSTSISLSPLPYYGCNMTRCLKLLSSWLLLHVPWNHEPKSTLHPSHFFCHSNEKRKWCRYPTFSFSVPLLKTLAPHSLLKLFWSTKLSTTLFFMTNSPYEPILPCFWLLYEYFGLPAKQDSGRPLPSTPNICWGGEIDTLGSPQTVNSKRTGHPLVMLTVTSLPFQLSNSSMEQVEEYT